MGIGNTMWWHPTNPNELTKEFTDKEDYQRGIVPIIYSNADTSIFQCEKSKATFMPLQHDWFYTLHKDTPIYQLINSDFKLFYKNINKKYLKINKNGVVIGFKTFMLKYKIGHYTQFVEPQI